MRWSFQQRFDRDNRKSLDFRIRHTSLFDYHINPHRFTLTFLRFASLIAASSEARALEKRGGGGDQEACGISQGRGRAEQRKFWEGKEGAPGIGSWRGGSGG